MKKYFFLFIVAPMFLFANTASLSKSSSIKADLVTVVKSERKMILSHKGKVFKTYNIALGGNPVGHKQVQGDQKTPEGYYKLDYFKANSSFYKALHISYPNRKDCRNARKKGKSPGGAIMIHGQPNNEGGWFKSFFKQRTDWTAGCIAMYNSDMDEVLKYVTVGTTIHIKP
ncbi:L,D-transpeptidase family protein [Sulfurovum mangrovi]|uniref:L,D-transpeptidase family protein n=1 Tax=Sulfurovum mangrovi TaxID=2893889 RepID=UPI001E563B57|nr:L,D-transpeptidase family protein [Sulfurovum mangrovi]UFH59766.1 L,D-transpeptidase family protein [Sulfurovum mangrovi]UFH60568.1 L,D-transpeptidase family protein [Sulfurovum mangrovi]